MSEIKQALPATGPYVERLVRIFRDRPDDDGSAVVLQDYARSSLSSAAVAERGPDSDRSFLLRNAVTRVSELEAENARLRADLAAKDAASTQWRDALDSMHRRALESEARLAEALKALEPFADIAGKVWADENGWTDDACQNDRICDWFGPSDFRTARSVREGWNVE